MRKVAEVTKKVLAFDIDHTLGLPKTPVEDEIIDLLVQALGKFEICIISGQDFDQFCLQILSKLEGVDSKLLKHLHCLPTQGTKYYRYSNGWKQVYSYDLSAEQTAKIAAVIEDAARAVGYWNEAVIERGDILIENRSSQVTFMGLGAQANYEDKCAWDPKYHKRNQIVARCKVLTDEFDLKIGGTTSIDVTIKNMDKSFGMKHLMEELKIAKKEILYFGDMTQPGGNDYPIVEMGIDTITVNEYHDTIWVLRGLLGIL